MEPVTCLLLVKLLIGGAVIGSAMERADARERLRIAQWACDCEEAAAQRALDGRNKQLVALDVSKATAQAWALQAIKTEAQRTGLWERVINGFPKIFHCDAAPDAGGDTYAGGAQAWMQRLPAAIDKQSIAAVLGAAGIAGAMQLDKHGIVDIPVLRESMHDLIASLPIDHAADVADVLAGASTLGDALAGGLMGFGVFRVFSNLKATNKMNQGADDMYYAARGYKALAKDYRRHAKQITKHTTSVDDAGFQVYRVMTLQRLAESKRGVEIDRPIYAARLAKAVQAWWALMKQPPVMA